MFSSSPDRSLHPGFLLPIWFFVFDADTMPCRHILSTGFTAAHTMHARVCELLGSHTNAVTIHS
jgi:hypothetical protein